MSENFKKCVQIILKNEGGYVNDPVDPGGETNYGIAKRWYPDLDIKNLTIEQAEEIYYKNYWQKMKLDLIENINIALQIFDFGVNAGTSKAIKTAQQLAMVNQDGLNGINTSGAINNYMGDFVKDYKHARKVYYEYLADKNPTSKKFLNGWLKRIEHTKL